MSGKGELDGSHVDFYNQASKVVQYHITQFYVPGIYKVLPKFKGREHRFLHDGGIALHCKHMWDGIQTGSCSGLNFHSLSRACRDSSMLRQKDTK